LESPACAPPVTTSLKVYAVPLVNPVAVAVVEAALSAPVVASAQVAPLSVDCWTFTAVAPVGALKVKLTC